MTKEITICVGVITSNRCKYLAECLDSILAQSCLPREVIVFNDGSIDETGTTVASRKERFLKAAIKFSYLSVSEHKGQAYGRNRITEHTDSDVIVFVDDDVICDQAWLENIGASYGDASVGGVGGPAIRVDSDQRSLWPEIRSVTNINIINKYGEVCDFSDNWLPPHAVETHIMRGANMSFRREVLRRYGEFDTKYFGRAYMEDVDSQVRIRNAGHKLIYNPKALVLHRAISVGGANLEDKKEDWYSIGYTTAYFINKYFRKYRSMTILRMFFRWRYSPIPFPRLFIRSIADRSVAPLWAIKGYWDGFRGSSKQRTRTR